MFGCTLVTMLFTKSAVIVALSLALLSTVLVSFTPSHVPFTIFSVSAFAAEYEYVNVVFAPAKFVTTVGSTSHVPEFCL